MEIMAFRVVAAGILHRVAGNFDTVYGNTRPLGFWLLGCYTVLRVI